MSNRWNRWPSRARLMTVALVMAMLGFAVLASEMVFFRIGTGGVGGTYYPVGGLIAQAISNPPGSRPCQEGGSCGVPGLVAVAQSANGSVANVEAIQAGILESAFVQSDVAHWAYTGTGIYADHSDRADNLRAVASLYRESIHLVAREDSGIGSVADLRGKRVSLDGPGSGTLVDARLILAAFGLSESDIQAEYLKPFPAIARMEKNQLDAFFIVAGYPIEAVVELTASGGATLVPIEGSAVDALLESHGFFARDRIPADIYRGIPETPTISVVALWVVDAGLDEELIHGITRALWRDTAQQLLQNGHAKAATITLDTALDGVGIPLHPGAERFYREAGVLAK